MILHDIQHISSCNFTLDHKAEISHSDENPCRTIGPHYMLVLITRDSFHSVPFPVSSHKRLPPSHTRIITHSYNPLYPIIAGESDFQRDAIFAPRHCTAKSHITASPHACALTEQAALTWTCRHSLLRTHLPLQHSQRYTRFWKHSGIPPLAARHFFFSRSSSDFSPLTTDGAALIGDALYLQHPSRPAPPRGAMPRRPCPCPCPRSGRLIPHLQAP